MAKIKAVVMTEPGKVELQELPYPKLERGALILKMRLSGICGTDKHAFKGETLLYEGTLAEENMVFPSVHGHENVGEIAEINHQDKDLIEYHGQQLDVGDRVTMCPNVICGHCWYCRHIFAYPFCANHKGIGYSYRSDRAPYVVGGWAEYMFVPPRALVYKIPEEMTDELASLVELFVVTSTLDRAKEFSRLEARGFGFGDTVVIQGAGALGVMHIIKAKMLGAGQIIVFDASDFKLRWGKDFGADVVMNIKKLSHQERIERIKELTQKRGADVVVECTGVPLAFREGLDYVRRGGTYIETGNFVGGGENIEINVHRHIASKNILLIGNTNHPHTGYHSAMKMMLKYQKEIPFEKLITHQFRLENCKQALEKTFEPEVLKVQFDMRECTPARKITGV